MMLADDPADVLQLRFAVVRAELPDNFAALLIDNGDNIGFAGVPDNVVGMEARIAGVIPFIRPQRRHRVDMHPVSHSAAAGAHIRVIVQRGARRIVEAQLMKMVAAAPLPDHIALPVDFNNGVVQQQLVGDRFINQIGVGEDQGIAAIDLRLQPRRVVADGVTRSLIVVMSARHPTRFIARVADLFVVVEFPGHVALPVHLDQIEHILHAIARVALAAVAKDGAAGQNFVGKPMQFRPFPHHVTIHIHQYRAVFGGLEKGVAAPGALRIVKCGAGRVNGRMSHMLLLK